MCIENKFLRPMIIQTSIAVFAWWILYLYVGVRHDEAMASMNAIQTAQTSLKSEISENIRDIKKSMEHMENRVDDLHKALIHR